MAVYKLNRDKLNHVFNESYLRKVDITNKTGLSTIQINQLLNTDSDIKLKILTSFISCFDKKIGYYFDEDNPEVKQIANGNGNHQQLNFSGSQDCVSDTVSSEVLIKSLREQLEMKDEIIDAKNDLLVELRKKIRELEEKEM